MEHGCCDPNQEPQAIGGVSAFAKTLLPEQDAPLWIPTLYHEVGEVTPIIPYTVWGHLSKIAMFDGVHSGIHEKLHFIADLHQIRLSSKASCLR
jgi:hypothetical protein